MTDKENNAQNGAHVDSRLLSEFGAPVDQDFIALIDERRLERECFVRSIEVLHPRVVMLSYSSAAEFLKVAEGCPPPRAVLLNIGSRRMADPEVAAEFEILSSFKNLLPVVVLAPSDDFDQMIAAFDMGAAGYIPATLGIEGIVEAAKLAAAGGVFLKFESLAKVRNSIAQVIAVPPELESLTCKQSAVAEGLRRGKANKTIAYELNMCESTVKVHIRNIMRKLKATNRTEAAFKLNSNLHARSQSD